jgi:6-phosphogluconolactonase (cycloisomerase 2 family)
MVGPFAYGTNTRLSDSITAMRVSPEGVLTLLDDGGVAAHTGAGPEDEAVTPDGRYLYTLNAVDQSISAFRVALDGGLTHLRDRSGLPRGAAGLVAR